MRFWDRGIIFRGNERYELLSNQFHRVPAEQFLRCIVATGHQTFGIGEHNCGANACCQKLRWLPALLRADFFLELRIDLS